ncbi:MAG TPA: Ig-like domain-containing protein [Gemmatimonadales bacterium]
MPIRNPQSTIRNCLCATLLLLAAAGSVRAQGTQSGPLRKTDLIRLLASGRPPGNVALMVRRRCLAFTPSPRDRFDLAEAGADKEVLDAMDGCASRAARPGGSAALRLVVPARLRATAGSEVTLTVRLLRGGVPQAGKSLQLRGATAIPGGALQEPGAVTDARGVATFHVLAGMEAGTWSLDVITVGDMPAQATVQLVTAAPTLLAEVFPPVVVVRQGSRTPALVRVVVRGAGGVPVAALPLELRGISAQLGPLPPVPTDGSGMALLPIPAGALRAGGTIGVYARGAQLAGVTARIETPAISDDRTQFIAGMGQRSNVHTTLRQPLLLEVRDTAGVPVGDYAVRFSAVNAALTNAETVTDSTGVARTTVTLGDRAGPVVITATVGRVSRTTNLYATAGPAQTLVVEQSGRPIDSLVLATPVTATVRMVARDAWGNEAILLGQTATVSGTAAGLRNLRGVATAPGTLVLEPRRNGRATLEVSATGEGRRLSARLPLQVTLPGSPGGWVYGARAGGAAFNYGFKSSPTIDGRAGFRTELMVGRDVAPGVRVLGGLGLGVVRAQAGPANVAVGLVQGLVRGEFDLTRNTAVVPVLTLGGGAYRIKSTDQNHIVYHTSLFWLAGAGVDFPLGPSVMGGVRVERQQLYEANSTNANGSVGALTLLELGVRVTP